VESCAGATTNVPVAPSVLRQNGTAERTNVFSHVDAARVARQTLETNHGPCRGSNETPNNDVGVSAVCQQDHPSTKGRTHPPALVGGEKTNLDPNRFQTDRRSHRGNGTLRPRRTGRTGPATGEGAGLGARYAPTAHPAGKEVFQHVVNPPPLVPTSTATVVAIRRTVGPATPAPLCAHVDAVGGTAAGGPTGVASVGQSRNTSTVAGGQVIQLLHIIY